MTEYLSVKAPHTHTLVIEKSRFIARCFPVTSLAEAEKILQNIRKTDYDATHHCYGAVLDKAGMELKFSDDGEPSGTAGLPLLETIRAKNLFQTLVVITRYFGGIKLGTGGLTRAYRSCAVKVLEEAEIVKYSLCSKFQILLDYPLYGGLERLVKIFSHRILSCEYGKEIQITLLVLESEGKRLTDSLKDLSSGQARVEKLGEEYYPLI